MKVSNLKLVEFDFPGEAMNNQCTCAISPVKNCPVHHVTNKQDTVEPIATIEDYREHYRSSKVELHPELVKLDAARKALDCIAETDKLALAHRYADKALALIDAATLPESE